MTKGEAIEWLGGISEAGKKIDYTLNEDDIEAIDTVLSELNRLQKSEEDLMINSGKIACEMSLKIDRLSQENEELKQKINDFVEEMRCME